MSQIAVNGPWTTGVAAPPYTVGVDRLSNPTPTQAPADHVEFQTALPTDSAQADELRIAEIRRQIAAGTYLTEHKLNAVVDRLYEVLKAPQPAAENPDPQK